MTLHADELRANAARDRSALEGISVDCAEAKNLLDYMVAHPMTIETEAAAAGVGMAIDGAIRTLKDETNPDTVDGYVSLLEGAGYKVTYDPFS